MLEPFLILLSITAQGAEVAAASVVRDNRQGASVMDWSPRGRVSKLVPRLEYAQRSELKLTGVVPLTEPPSNNLSPSARDRSVYVL